MTRTKTNVGWMLWIPLMAVGLVSAACSSDSDNRFAPGADERVDEILENADVDEIIDQIQDGADPEDLLEDVMENAEAMAVSLGDDGSGRIEIYGESIEFTSEVCFAGQGDFTIEGIGKAADGRPVWVSINHSVDSREELEQFIDKDMVEMLYGDADPIIDSSVSVDFGREELFGAAPDDQPSFAASGGHLIGDAGLLEIQASNSGVSGSGEASDHNFVAGEFDDRYPFTFQASCG